MRSIKLFLLSLLFVSMAGLGYAANIPELVDPDEGPEVWVTSVYNNSGGTLDAGDIVVWDISSSTGDNDNYVTTTTSACTHLVAGVVYPNDIAAGKPGTIAIRGIVDVDAVSGTIVTNTAIGTSATAGAATVCPIASGWAVAGHATAQEASNTVKAYLQCR